MGGTLKSLSLSALLILAPPLDKSGSDTSVCFSVHCQQCMSLFVFFCIWPPKISNGSKEDGEAKSISTVHTAKLLQHVSL